ncbi:MAG TPA: hypothetical protein P5137_00980 [Candidatus Brocadiia bacterium]|nr:hypothetical protein [Candidatus Brocadiia bacterium]
MANVTMTFDAETAKLVNAFMTVENKQKALEERTRRLAEASKTSSDDAVKSIEAWGRKAATLVSSYVSISAAISAAKNALAAYNAEQAKAAESARADAMPLGKLAQLAGGEPERMKKLVERARSMTRFGMSVPQGADLIFALESMGLGGGQHDAAFGQQYGVLESPARFAEGVATLQAAMGVKETGGVGNVMNKLFAASAVSKTTLEEFAPAATVAAKTAAGAKTTDEELLAALAHMSKSTRSADVAATEIAAFAKSTIKRGMSEPGLLARAKAIQAKGYSEKQLVNKVFGRMEAYKGYKGLLEQSADIEATIADLGRVDRETGTDKDLAARIAASRIAADPRLYAEQQARQAALREKEALASRNAVARLRRETAESDWKTESANAGQWALRRNIPLWVSGWMPDSWAESLLRAEADRLRGRGPLAAGSPGSFDSVAFAGFQSQGSTIEPGRPIRVILSGDERNRTDDLRPPRNAGTE